jgi:hypothetical protein
MGKSINNSYVEILRVGITMGRVGRLYKLRVPVIMGRRVGRLYKLRVSRDGDKDPCSH